MPHDCEHASERFEEITYAPAITRWHAEILLRAGAGGEAHAGNKNLLAKSALLAPKIYSYRGDGLRVANIAASREVIGIAIAHVGRWTERGGCSARSADVGSVRNRGRPRQCNLVQISGLVQIGNREGQIADWPVKGDGECLASRVTDRAALNQFETVRGEVSGAVVSQSLLLASDSEVL